MNIITTIPEREDERWVHALFTKNREIWPIDGRTPADPPIFPFARVITKDVTGGTLYLVYKKNIIGYAEIKKKEEEKAKKVSVGLKPEDVGPGTRLTLRKPLEWLLPPIPCVGFRNFRYTTKNLHEIGMKNARAELKRLGLKSPSPSPTRPKSKPKTPSPSPARPKSKPKRPR